MILVTYSEINLDTYNTNYSLTKFSTYSAHIFFVDMLPDVISIVSLIRGSYDSVFSFFFENITFQSIPCYFASAFFFCFLKLSMQCFLYSCKLIFPRFPFESTSLISLFKCCSFFIICIRFSLFSRCNARP